MVNGKPLILYLNPGVGGPTAAALVSGQTVVVARGRQTPRRAGESLLQLAAAVLGRFASVRLQAVAVVSRPPKGAAVTFSQLRAGVMCANAIGFAAQAAVFSTSATTTAAFAKSDTRRTRGAARHRIVLPRYLQPPNITVPKR